MTKQQIDILTEAIIGIAIDVHKELGAGLLESVYQKCLKIALEQEGFSVKSELPVPVFFRGVSSPEIALQKKVMRNGRES